MKKSYFHQLTVAISASMALVSCANELHSKPLRPGEVSPQSQWINGVLAEVKENLVGSVAGTCRPNPDAGLSNLAAEAFMQLKNGDVLLTTPAVTTGDAVSSVEIISKYPPEPDSEARLHLLVLVDQKTGRCSQFDLHVLIP